MPITRDPNNFNSLVDFTQEINQIDRQYSVLPSNLFDMRPTTQSAILFDINSTDTVLLPTTERGGRGSTYGDDNNVETRALPLAFFKHSDYLTVEDVQSVRQVGTADAPRTVDLAIAEKMEKMRRKADQTEQYMMMKAAFTGKCITPDGNVFADLFQEMGVVQTEIDLALGTATTDLQNKLREIKRAVRAGVTNGGMFGGISVYMDPEMYDRFISHASMKEAYKYFAATADNLLRDDVTDQFRTGGITFYSLDGSFKLPTGSSENLVAANTGHVIPSVDGLFRGYYGVSDKLSHANNASAVSPLYLFQYDDGKDESKEMQIQMSRLVFPTQPKALIKLTSSN